tara:strand:- start:277 stop:2061 length:1785 start_codon:yes stop_codon:yes gene_type:complete
MKCTTDHSARFSYSESNFRTTKRGIGFAQELFDCLYDVVDVCWQVNGLLYSNVGFGLNSKDITPVKYVFRSQNDLCNPQVTISVELGYDSGRITVAPLKHQELLADNDSCDDLRSSAIKSLIDQFRPRKFGFDPIEIPVRRYVERSIEVLSTVDAAMAQRPTLGELIWPIVRSPDPVNLYEFQKTGVKFLNENDGAMLADDMGLGKSAQTIVAANQAVSSGDIKHCLLVCPKTLVVNWLREIRKWAPDLSAIAIAPDRQSREPILKAVLGKCHILITNYEQIRSQNRLLSNFFFDLVIADEAHRLRTFSSGLNIAFRKINRRKTWMLSGTPLENRLSDFSSLLSLMLPNEFSSNTKFTSLPELRTNARPFVLRRNKKDVLSEIPAVLIEQEYLEMGEEQTRSYQKAEKQWQDASAESKLSTFTNLRTVCDLDPVSQKSVKCDRIIEILQSIRESSEKAVVFSHRIPPLEYLYAQCVKTFPSQAIVVTGETEQSIRDDSIQRFIQDKNCFVAFLSQQTASEGLTLTAASHVIFLNEWWNPSSNDQARDRLVRIGQKNVVTQWSFVVEGTIETRLQSILSEKREDFQNIVERLSSE